MEESTRARFVRKVLTLASMAVVLGAGATELFARVPCDECNYWITTCYEECEPGDGMCYGNCDRQYSWCINSCW